MPERRQSQWCVGRLRPSFAMRVSSVVGLSPSRSAAPPAPRIRQPVLSRTRGYALLDLNELACVCRGSVEAGKVWSIVCPLPRSSRARRRCGVRGCCRARDSPAAPPCCPWRSTRSACRTLSRTPQRNARRGAGCLRPAHAAAAPGSERRSAGSRDRPGTSPRRPAARDRDGWRR